MFLRPWMDDALTRIEGPGRVERETGRPLSAIDHESRLNRPPRLLLLDSKPAPGRD